MADDSTKNLSKIIWIDDSQVRADLDEMVRGAGEDALNSLLNAEADEMWSAQRYERSPDQIETRAGHYTHMLDTNSGEVALKMPKLREHAFEIAIIGLYCRRYIWIKEVIVQMYLAGAPVRRVKDITEAPSGTRITGRPRCKLTTPKPSLSRHDVNPATDSYRLTGSGLRYSPSILTGIVYNRLHPSSQWYAPDSISYAH